jgi:hypothetical protein
MGVVFLSKLRLFSFPSMGTLFDSFLSKFAVVDTNSEYEKFIDAK